MASLAQSRRLLPRPGSQFVTAVQLSPHDCRGHCLRSTADNYEPQAVIDSGNHLALDAGATDFLLSPVDHNEFRARARNLLMLRRQQEIIRKRALTLEQRLRVSDRLHKQAIHTSTEMLRLVVNSVPAMISATDDQYTVIEFDDHGSKRFITRMVALESTSVPAPAKASPAKRARKKKDAEKN